MTDLATLFPDVDPKDLALAESRFYTVEVGRGVTLMEEGEQDAAVLFIVEGHVAIRTGEFEIATVGPGGLIGEIGLFGAALRIASVRAIQACVFVVLDRRDYDALVEMGNPVAYHLEKAALKQLTERLRQIDTRIAALGEGGGTEPIVPGEADGGSPTSSCDILDVLRQSTLFEGAPIGALDDVAQRMEPRAFAAGDALCRQGTLGNDLFLLASGTVEVVVRGEEGRVESLATLEAGDVFGMASVLNDRPRMASCVALEPVVALRMGREQCLDLARADSRAGSVLRTAMIRALGDQVAYANSQFAMLSLARKKRTTEYLARLGIEAHGRHVQNPRG